MRAADCEKMAESPEGDFRQTQKTDHRSVFCRLEETGKQREQQCRHKTGNHQR